MEPVVTLHEDCHYVCPESSPCDIHYLLHEETQVFNWLALEERCLVRDTTQYLCHLDHLGKTLYIPYVNNEPTVAYRPGKWILWPTRLYGLMALVMVAPA